MKIGLIGWRNFTGIGSQNYDLWLAGLTSTWLRHATPGRSSRVSRHRRRPGLRSCGSGANGSPVRSRSRCRPIHRATVCWRKCARARATPANLSYALRIGNGSRRCRRVGSGLPLRFIARTLIALTIFPGLSNVPWSRCPGGWSAAIGGRSWLLAVCRARDGEPFLFPAGNQGVDQRKARYRVAGGCPRSPHPMGRAVAVRSVFRQRKRIGSRRQPHGPPRCYRDGDVLVLLSRWEGCGLSFYEGRRGLPVVTVDAEPMRSIGLPFLFQSA